MTKILFICLGNICRSPMAKFVMKDLVEKAGLADEFQIDSAATCRDEIGNPVYPPVRALLEARGISCKGKYSVQLRREDYPNYDYFIGMDARNRRDMLRIFGGDPENKVHLLLDYTDHPHEIADPWYTRDFRKAEAEINEGCAALLRTLRARDN